MFWHVSVHPSIRLSVHTCGGLPEPGPGGEYPSQVHPPTLGTLLLDLAGVDPPGGTLLVGVPHLRYPLSDLAGRGTPLGGTPTLGTLPPIRPGQRGILPVGYPARKVPHFG